VEAPRWREARVCPRARSGPGVGLGLSPPPGDRARCAPHPGPRRRRHPGRHAALPEGVGDGEPAYPSPPADIQTDLLLPIERTTVCEWKGRARYFSVRLPTRLIETAAWSYLEPFAEFEAIRGFIAFYLNAVECLIDDERVRRQPGHYYGGWVTSEIVGPFKGEPGTGGW